MLVSVRPADGILEHRLSRPDRLNALMLALTRDLVAAVRQAMQDEGVRVLLLTGSRVNA